jgi:hypothetical protein
MKNLHLKILKPCIHKLHRSPISKVSGDRSLGFGFIASAFGYLPAIDQRRMINSELSPLYCFNYFFYSVLSESLI